MANHFPKEVNAGQRVEDSVIESPQRHGVIQRIRKDLSQGVVALN